MKRPRLLIEDWLPAQAIGVECMRERATGQQPPDKRLHVWWARRPLTVSRAAVLGSLLPADFDHATFEKLLGFYAPSKVLIQNAQALEKSRQNHGKRIRNPHGPRAFGNVIQLPSIENALKGMKSLWGNLPIMLDPMAGGGSIPLESARLGITTLANELNPVACTVLEATVDLPFRYGKTIAGKTRKWAKLWLERFNMQMSSFYETEGIIPAYSYIFARTVPCPDTKYPTPLVPDWHLLKPDGGLRVVADPLVNKDQGTWTIRIREIGNGAGQLRQPPSPTYDDGEGISLFSKKPIPSDYIKAMAQQGKLESTLYVVVTKATSKIEFRPPNKTDLRVLESARNSLDKTLPGWVKGNLLPNERIPQGDKTKEPQRVGHSTWASLFSNRQLLAMGVLVEELAHLRKLLVNEEDPEIAEAIYLLLSLMVDKFANHNSIMSRWDPTTPKIASVFDRHDYAFKPTWAEMAACVPDGGLEWAMENVADAYEKLSDLPKNENVLPVRITQGSADNLIDYDDKSITAIVVDPPYADNVQYSELADFFYVWLKRTQGYRHPDWFSAYLCDHTYEAVVNQSRHQEKGGDQSTKAKSHAFYEKLMTDIFYECRRVLRDDGALTVMFTHKEQSAWAALFESLITAGFNITATWPVKTESDVSLHQAKKNAAQSTVILISRKREPDSGRGYFDDQIKAEIRAAAQSAAARFRDEGLNAVDQLVGAFGPAMEVFSRYDEVYTDTGQRVPVAEAIQVAANAVADWRVAQLAARGLEGVDPGSRFVLLCWDVLGAVELRFNEAMLLGRSVGMDVNTLVALGLVTKRGDKVLMNPAAKRRRDGPVKTVAEQLDLLGNPAPKRKRSVREVHPQDQFFVSAIDMCHALAMRYAEAGGSEAGIGAAKGLALQQGWTAENPCARLMEALVHAAPQAVRFAGKSKSVADEFPEFRAWHAMLKPLFGIEPPAWDALVEAQPKLFE
jgi:putative DNA methylase